MTTDQERADERHLQVLLADYAEARDDERSFTNSTGVAFGLLLAVLGALAAFANSDKGLDIVASPEFDLLKVIVPSAPLAIIIYLQLQATTTIVRSYYMRSLEAEIAALDAAGRATDSLAGTYVQVLLTVTSLRRGNRRYRFLALVVLVILVVVFGGMVVFLAFTVRPPYAVAIAVLYLPPVVLLARENYAVTIRGNRMWAQIMADRPYFPIPGFRPFVPRNPDGRSLLSYLVLPRLEELVKLSFVAVGFVVGSLFLGTLDKRTVGSLILAVVVFEYLVYEARYQWNDLRGALADRSHTETTQRGRLPVGSTDAELVRAVKVSAGVAAARLVAALVICVTLVVAVPSWRTTTWLVLAASVAALGVAWVYEFLRSEDSSSEAIWLVVGGGYAIRVALGVMLPASTTSDQSLVWLAVCVIAVVIGWSVGSASILMTWALEASAALVVPAGRITGNEHPPDTAASDRRPRTDLQGVVPFADPAVALVLTASSRRVHIKDLAPFTDLLRGATPHDVPEEEVSLDHRSVGAFPVLQRSPRDTPWNRRAILAAGATGAVGVWAAASWAIPGRGPTSDAVVIALGLVTGAVVAVVAWRVVGWMRTGTRWCGWIGATALVATGAAFATLVEGAPSVGRTIAAAGLAVLPFCYFHIANYTLFRDASYHGLKHPFRPFKEVVHRLAAAGWHKAWRALVGVDLAARLTRVPERPDPPT